MVGNYATLLYSVCSASFTVAEDNRFFSLYCARSNFASVLDGRRILCSYRDRTSTGVFVVCDCIQAVK